MFSKESFMANQNIISFGKLKASYGLNGNVSGVGAYELQGSYVGSSKYNGTSTFVLGSVPNPGLRWEKSRTLEMGLDLSYLQNRYSTNFTVYDRLTSDKFASLSLPISSGISSIRTNNGSFRNRLPTTSIRWLHCHTTVYRSIVREHFRYIRAKMQPI
jgi:hypothetical protein